MKGAIKAVKKVLIRVICEQVEDPYHEENDSHKQDKYGPSTLKQRLKTGADHDIDAEKK